MTPENIFTPHNLTGYKNKQVHAVLEIIFNHRRSSHAWLKLVFRSQHRSVQDENLINRSITILFNRTKGNILQLCKTYRLTCPKSTYPPNFLQLTEMSKVVIRIGDQCSQFYCLPRALIFLFWAKK